jgi:hypothetical protein
MIDYGALERLSTEMNMKPSDRGFAYLEIGYSENEREVSN